MTTKAIVSLSGGMDSATVLAQALSAGREVEAVGFYYGSKHNRYENVCAALLAAHYDVPYQLLSFRDIAQHFRSNLLQGQGAVPEGHYEQENMTQTVVPGRNIIFISILAGLAWSRDAGEIWLGIHQGDHAIYEDCRPGFFHAMNMAIREGTGARVTLRAPFLDTNKSGIVRRGLELQVPYGLTRTCYKDQEVACGKCGSCVERREAFLLNDAKDPIPYQDNSLLPAKPGV